MRALSKGHFQGPISTSGFFCLGLVGVVVSLCSHGMGVDMLVANP